MRVSQYLIPAAAVVALAVSVAVTQLSGQWVATGGADMERRIAAGEQMSPADIKGWMTFEEVSTTYGVPIDELMKGLGLEGTPASTPLRDLESSGFDVGVAREWVAEFTGGGAEGVATSTPADEPSPSCGRAAAAATPENAAADIRGTSSLTEVSAAFKIPVGAIMQAAGLPPGTATDVPMRDLKLYIPGFEVEIVRIAVAKLTQ